MANPSTKGSDYVGCHVCLKQTKPTVEGRYRKHTFLNRKEECEASGTFIPQEHREASCESNPTANSTTAPSAKPSPDDARPDAESATTSTPSSPASPAPADGASTATAPDVLPGVTEYAEALGRAKAQVFSQPAPLFSQPAPKLEPEPTVPMTDLGREITTRFKEIFYAYDNRRSADNRSAQVTMGPSEMGTPCDRRLALSLMRMPPVNPGGDGWAAFVGTCIHAGLSDMFVWASGTTGRFASEMPLTFPSKLVPKGTGDLLDRTLCLFVDFKAMGRWSRNKLRTKGPSQTYRVQVHTYAKGARDRGEVIDHVAIIALPRDEASLDDMYVWTEPYNPKIPADGFARVEQIGADVEQKLAMAAVDVKDELTSKALVASEYDVADDCRFCPFHLPNARSIKDGCNGRR